MRFLKLSILVSVLFFGMAYGQKSSKPKSVKEDVVYKDTDKVDKKAHFSKGGDNGFHELLASNTDLNKIDGYEDFPEETKKEIQKFISEYNEMGQCQISWQREKINHLIKKWKEL